MAIVDERGDRWTPIIVRDECMGYRRDADQFRWSDDPRVPIDTSLGWGAEIPGGLPLNRTVRLPPTVSEIADQRGGRKAKEDVEWKRREDEEARKRAAEEAVSQVQDLREALIAKIKHFA